MEKDEFMDLSISELEANIKDSRINESKENNKIENKTKNENEKENDYNSYHISNSEKYLIVKQLVDLVAGLDSKINIKNMDGSINNVSSKIVNEIFKKNNVIQTIKNAYINSLITGYSLTRIAGDAFNPLIYLADSKVATWDKANENNIKKLFAILQLNNGAEKIELVYETYNIYTKKLLSKKGNLTRVTNISAPSELPYVLFVPHKNWFTNSYEPYVDIVKERFEFLEANYNKLMVYAKDVNYHLLPDKANLIENREDKLWKNKVHNLFIFRKNNVSTKPNYKEAIERIEPNMDWYLKIYTIMEAAGHWVNAGLGLIDPAYSGTKQMSEHEIAAMKQKEKITIAVFRMYLEAKLKIIVSKWIDIDNFDLEIVPLELPTKNEIDKEKMEIENDE